MTEQQDDAQKAVEALVGNLPAFAEGVDTGAGISIPKEGQESLDFMQAYMPQPAPATPPNGQPVSQNQTQATPPPQAQQPAPAAQPSTIPSGRLLAGKYRSVEELERGYKEADRERRERNEENLALRAANIVSERVGRQPRNEPQPLTSIPVQFEGDKPVVPVSDLRAEMLQAARTAAQETVTGILTPMQQLGSANASLRASYPEFAQQEGNFAMWLRERPDYQGLIQQNPEVGLESAYLKYQRDAGLQQASHATQATLAAQQQIGQAQQHAAPAGGSAPAGRRVTETDAIASTLKRLYDEWQTTGDPAAKKRYTQYRLEQALGGQVMGTLEKSQWGR